MTAANVKIFNTEEVQNFINLLSGLEQEGGNPRIKQIIHRVVSDLFKTIEDLQKVKGIGVKFIEKNRSMLSL